jgi:hypothetical protein
VLLLEDVDESVKVEIVVVEVVVEEEAVVEREGISGRLLRVVGA